MRARCLMLIGLGVAVATMLIQLAGLIVQVRR